MVPFFRGAALLYRVKRKRESSEEGSPYFLGVSDDVAGDALPVIGGLIETEFAFRNFHGQARGEVGEALRVNGDELGGLRQNQDLQSA